MKAGKSKIITSTCQPARNRRTARGYDAHPDEIKELFWLRFFFIVKQKTLKSSQGNYSYQKTFFYPDCTVDPGVAPDLCFSALVGFYHRSGIESLFSHPALKDLLKGSILPQAVPVKRTCWNEIFVNEIIRYSSSEIGWSMI